MAVLNNAAKPDRKTIMGFTGKTLESANYLLQDADGDSSEQGKKHWQQALAIIQSFLKLKLSPPIGEGFNFDTGKPDLAIPREKRVYLRSFGDDLKALLKAEKREKASGREHPDWIQWARSFADWLLPQQNKAGGFPRTWRPFTGEVVDTSSASTYTVIPYLLLLAEATGEQLYKEAAIKAGTYCLQNSVSGVFVGGTIDNPNVIDKEAGTLSLEAYLALYHVTKKRQWLTAAQGAANYAETWMYVWNVPMPQSADNNTLGWKRGVPTTGLQLISSGHSLVDAYMAFDVDEYAQLFTLLHDPHYYDVARLLLHNTKSMLALPGRVYDLKGPGWQQEHWSLAPVRGNGLHRGWLPWVSTSHLNGIFGLQEFDRLLYNQLIKYEGNK